MTIRITPEATHHVLRRRILAWLIDVLIVSVVMATLHLILAILGILTLGLGWLLYGLLPAVPFLYSVGTLAGRHAATPGQRLLGLVVTHIDGRRPTPLEALVSTLVFYFSLAVPLVLLLALVTPRHRSLHDLVSGLLIVRTHALTDTGSRWNMGRPQTA